MICPVCWWKGMKSKVYTSASFVTCMGWQSYYDEDGHYHSHDPNRASFGANCSQGHRWHIDQVHGCSAAGCDYGGSEIYSFDEITELEEGEVMFDGGRRYRVEKKTAGGTTYAPVEQRAKK